MQYWTVGGLSSVSPDQRMKILSFVYGRGCHDTSAAIVCDGVLCAAAEEERFSRIRHDSSFPFHAIEYCLRQTGLSMEQIDYIAFPEKPWRTGPDSYTASIAAGTVRAIYARGHTSLLNVAHKYLLDRLLQARLAPNVAMEPTIAAGFAQLRTRYPKLPPVRFYEHHRAHAAAAYLTSGAPSGAIVTADFCGGPDATVTWKGHGTSLSRMREQPWDNSLGAFYWNLTGYLGLSAEGKTMGLAAWGDPARFQALFDRTLAPDPVNWYSYIGWPGDAELGAPPRTSEDPLLGPWPDIAAAAQMALERAWRTVADSALEGQSDAPLLCLGGGVALNCSANGVLLQSGLAGEVWVFPASGDAGLSVGAALLCAAELGELQVARLPHAYWGPEFSRTECEAAIRREPRVTVFEPTGSLEEATVAALAQGQVIAICRGRMELGPRALGNRSIVADPRSAASRDRVNRLKGRELWRPLAPAVPAECADDYFDLRQSSPFMLFRADVWPHRRAEIPGAVHVDGSARPQTVTPATNPFFHRLLSAFGKLSGVPVVLNTSFNTATEPIVCTPDDAIRTFLAAGLDMLVLDDLLVRRVA